MVYAFVFLAVIVTCSMIACISYLQHAKMRERVAMQTMLGVSSASLAFYFLGMFVEQYFLSMLFFGMYFWLSSIHILTFLNVSESYNVVYRRARILKILAVLLSGADFLFLVLNSFFEIAFSLNRIRVDDNFAYHCFVAKFPGFFIHLSVFYIYMILLLSALIIKARKTIKLYRSKYTILTISVLITLAVNVIVSNISLPVDFSGVLYAGLSMLIVYLILSVIPRAEAESIVKYSLDGISNGIICFNKDNICVYVNKVARELFHLMGNEIAIETTFGAWLEARNPQDIPYQTFQEEKNIGGVKIYYDTTYNPLVDETNNYFGCVFSMRNKTEDVQALAAERERAELDSLTGVYNRESFFSKVKEILNEDTNKKWILVCTDIKDFKTYNALFGEKQGDEILVNAARILNEDNREDIFVGRLVSDRFVVCVPEEYFDESMLLERLKKICSCVKSDMFKLHIHAGIYPIHDYSMEVSVMCDHAYLAVRKIKDDYGVMTTWYDANVGADHRNTKLMIGEFEKALEEGQFQMFLQPQLSGSGEILGAEALVRWIHPSKGLIPPIEFIPVFERAGLIHKLDQYVWRMACSKLSAWQSEGKGHLYISVNISPLDFYYVDIHEYITNLVQEYKIDPKSLKLEITETAIVNEAADNLLVIDKLRQSGFEVEIDDFGSGYSSLNTLKDIEVDAIKLDRIFLKETSHKEKSKVIMDNTIIMSKQLGIKVVSEGVETKEQVDYLVDAGCDVFQGYYFDRPISVPAFEEKYLMNH